MDAMDILGQSRGDVRQRMRLLSGLILEALTGDDAALSPVIQEAEALVAKGKKHLDLRRRLNETAAGQAAPVVRFPAVAPVELS